MNHSENNKTRNPERIEPLLEKLKETWKTMPDMRFCQLVQNIAFSVTGREDNFYLEDDKFLEAIDSWNKNYGKKL